MVAAAWAKAAAELPHRLRRRSCLLPGFALLAALIPYRWHSIPLGPAAGWLSLSAYLALFPATWVWLLSEGRPGTAGERGPHSEGPASRVLPLRCLGARRGDGAHLGAADVLGHFGSRTLGRTGDGRGAALHRLSVEPAGLVAIPDDAADSNRFGDRHLWCVVSGGVAFVVVALGRPDDRVAADRALDLGGRDLSAAGGGRAGVQLRLPATRDEPPPHARSR